MNVLIVYAQPEPTSLTRCLVDESVQTLREQGHTVSLSDLYGMRWKAVFDADDFPVRANRERLSFITESGHAYSTAQQTPDVESEQRKLLAADALIMQFPLWWFSMPAILKGWVDRVFAIRRRRSARQARNAVRGCRWTRGRLFATGYQRATGSTAVSNHPRHTVLRRNGCAAHACDLRERSHQRIASRSREISLAPTADAAV